MVDEGNEEFDSASGDALAAEIQQHLQNPLTRTDEELRDVLNLDRIDFPPEYEHLSHKVDPNTYEAPFTDHFLDDETFTGYQEYPLTYLQQLIQLEKTELRYQEQNYIKDHPEWTQQKIMVDAANHSFVQNPMQQTVDVSLDVDENGNPSAVYGRKKGTLYRTFNYDEIKKEFVNANSFLTQQILLSQMYEIVSRMAQGESVSLSKFNDLEKYISRKKDRWTEQKRHKELNSNPWKQTERRTEFITQAMKIMEDYPVTEGLIDSDEPTEAERWLTKETEFYLEAKASNKKDPTRRDPEGPTDKK